MIKFVFYVKKQHRISVKFFHIYFLKMLYKFKTAYEKVEVSLLITYSGGLPQFIIGPHSFIMKG